MDIFWNSPMQVCNASGPKQLPLTFRSTKSMDHSALCRSSWSEKSGKTGKNVPSVTGGQRAVSICTGVMSSCNCKNTMTLFLLLSNKAL